MIKVIIIHSSAARSGRGGSAHDARRALMISLQTFIGGGIVLPLVLSTHAASAPYPAARKRMSSEQLIGRCRREADIAARNGGGKTVTRRLDSRQPHSEARRKEKVPRRGGLSRHRDAVTTRRQTAVRWPSSPSGVRQIRAPRNLAAATPRSKAQEPRW